MKIKLAQAKFIQTMHPLVAIKMKKRKKRNNQRENKIHTQKAKVEESMTLTQIKIKRSVGL